MSCPQARELAGAPPGPPRYPCKSTGASTASQRCGSARGRHTSTSRRASPARHPDRTAAHPLPHRRESRAAPREQRPRSATYFRPGCSARRSESTELQSVCLVTNCLMLPGLHSQEAPGTRAKKGARVKTTQASSTFPTCGARQWLQELSRKWTRRAWSPCKRMRGSCKRVQYQSAQPFQAETSCSATLCAPCRV